MPEETVETHQRLMTELRTVLTDRTNAATETRITLRDAICDFVVVEQARGSGLKRIIKSVKEMLRSAEKDAATATEGARHSDDALAQKIVDWCVEFHRQANLPVT